VDDAGFIVASYGLALVALTSYAWFVVRRARRASRHVKAEDLPWT
jgi:hypothetical protein